VQQPRSRPIHPNAAPDNRSRESSDQSSFPSSFFDRRDLESTGRILVRSWGSILLLHYDVWYPKSEINHQGTLTQGFDFGTFGSSRLL